ncbi:MAG: polysaccharide deacetylase family protein, partial [bacterium]
MKILRHASAAAARLITSRDATILCYHGIEQRGPIDPGSPHVSVARFRDAIDVACSVAKPVALRELIERRVAGRSTAGLFAVTFDDAYVSLADPAVREILHGGRLPITVFVVSGSSATGLPFWWDRVETVQRAVAASVWAEFEQAIGIASKYRTAASISYGPLRPLRQWVLDAHAGRWPRGAEAALSALETRAGVRPAQRPMTFDELDAFVRTGHVDLGVHTVSHPVLPLLADAEVSREIKESHAALIERWPSTIPWLAVPFGLYDERTSQLAREAGLEGILNLHPYPMSQMSATHGIPRMNVMENVPAWKLALRLGGLAPVLWRSPAALPFP